MLGSDWPGAASPNPWIAIETLSTRKAPGGAGLAYADSEAISLKEAIDLYTRSGAIEMGEPGERGTIEVGVRADLVVLDRSPFDIRLTEVPLDQDTAHDRGWPDDL